MAETSYLWDNPGTGDSPALGYGHTEFMTEMFRMLWNGTGNRGVLRGWLNELEVTDGGANTAIVLTGGAVDYGFGYENTANVNVNVPVGPRTDLIVVRCSWAAQTARITRIAGPGAALTQNPGVTYDIPLAQVVVDALGALTITDQREFCEYTTDLIDNVVEAAHIQADAITTAKLENQTRWVFRGLGTLEPDPTNPPTFQQNRVVLPYNNAWEFSAAALEALWLTLIIPDDYAAGTATLYVWNMPWGTASGGNVLWGWSSYDAQPSAVLVNQAGTLAVAQAGRAWGTMYRDALTTLAVAAGDIFHIEVYRNGAGGGDTETSNTWLYLVEIAYTADS